MAVEDFALDDHNDDAVEAAFLARMEGTEEKPQETTEEPAEAPETTETTDDTGEVTEASSEPAEAVETPADKLADDDHLVVVKEGDTERRVSVADLRALLARETAITKRDEETVASLKRVNDEGERAIVIMNHLVTEAQKEWQMYANMDLALAARKLPEDAYLQLKKDHQAAWNKLNFLTQTGNQYVAQVRANRTALAQQDLAKCDEALAKDTDPLVKGWTKESRKEVRDYAVAQGLPAEFADGIVNPVVIKLLKKAALYDKGTKAVATTVKAAATSSPARVIKPGSQGQTATTTQTPAQLALAKARKSGNESDIEAAFLARLG